MTEHEGWRVAATIDRLISNIPAACIALREEGHINLAFQLRMDRENLVYWQAHGGLTFTVPFEEEENDKASTD